MASTSRPSSTPNRTGQRSARSADELLIAIIEAIAKAEAVPVSEIDIQLHDHLDVEALMALYEHASEHNNPEWSFSFAVEAFEVTIECDGRITVENR